MTNEFLRPPDLRTHLDDLSGTSSLSRSKSITSSSSRTSITSSIASKFAKASRDPAVRAGLEKAGWSRKSHKSRSEGKAGASSGHQNPESEDRSTSHTPGSQGILPVQADLGIGAIFDLVDRRLPPNLPPAINLIPPTGPASETSGHNMANSNQVPLSLWEAAWILSSHGCKVSLGSLPANTNTPAGRPVSPTPRARRDGPQLQGQVRVDRSPEAALELVRRNGGEVVFPPRTQEPTQMVVCDVTDCTESFSSDTVMEQHRRRHPFCLQCNRQYAEHSHDEHLRRYHDLST